VNIIEKGIFFLKIKFFGDLIHKKKNSLLKILKNSSPKI
jgi:hypothetical protein